MSIDKISLCDSFYTFFKKGLFYEQTYNKKYNLKAEETILVDDRIYNQYAAINVGAHPVRMCCEFTTDLPDNLKWIPQVKSTTDFKDWLLANTKIK